jgi:hypothetical protein
MNPQCGQGHVDGVMLWRRFLTIDARQPMPESSARQPRGYFGHTSPYPMLIKPDISPATKTGATELGQRGGRRRQHTYEQSTKDIAPPASAAEVRRMLAETMAEVKAGRMDPKVANAVAYVATVLLRAYEVDAAGSAETPTQPFKRGQLFLVQRQLHFGVVHQFASSLLGAFRAVTCNNRRGGGIALGVRQQGSYEQLLQCGQRHGFESPRLRYAFPVLAQWLKLNPEYSDCTTTGAHIFVHTNFAGRVDQKP